MAYLLNGANQSFSANSAIADLDGSSGTILITFRTSASVAAQRVLSFCSAANNFCVNVSGTGNTAMGGWSAGTTNLPSGTLTQYAPGGSVVGVWFTLAASWSSGARGATYINGNAGTSLTTSIAANAANNYQFGQRSSGNFLTGEIAQYAFYDRALTNEEMRAVTASPFAGRSLRPRVFIPFIRETIDFCGRATVTPVNAPVVSTHPRIFWP